MLLEETEGQLDEQMKGLEKLNIVGEGMMEDVRLGTCLGKERPRIVLSPPVDRLVSDDKGSELGSLCELLLDGSLESGYSVVSGILVLKVVWGTRFWFQFGEVNWGFSKLDQTIPHLYFLLDLMFRFLFFVSFIRSV